MMSDHDWAHEAGQTSVIIGDEASISRSDLSIQIDSDLKEAISAFDFSSRHSV